MYIIKFYYILILYHSRTDIPNFKICQYFYFHGIALFKHLKMSQKSILTKLTYKCPKIKYIMHDQLLRYLA